MCLCRANKMEMSPPLSEISHKKKKEPDFPCGVFALAANAKSKEQVANHKSHITSGQMDKGPNYR